MPTGSMKPTILEGDRIFVNKLAYDLKIPFTTWHLAQWDDPQCGDIVVFYSPSDGKRLVKRVVGLPGDRIGMWKNQVILNGVPLQYGSLEQTFIQELASEAAARASIFRGTLTGAAASGHVHPGAPFSKFLCAHRDSCRALFYDGRQSR